MSEKRIITDVNISGELTVDEDVTTDQHFKQAAEPTLEDHAVNKKSLDKEINALMVTLTQVRNRLDAVESGLSHGTNVEDILDVPPVAAHSGMFWIVGQAPTGAWAGQNNYIAESQPDGSWVFSAPDIGDTHYVEQTNSQLSWTARGWVRVGGAQAAQSGGFNIGSIQQSTLSEAQFKTTQMGLAESAKWCLADGRDVTGSGYATVTGRTHVPDLRGAFIQGAGANNTQHNGNVPWNGGSLLRASNFQTGPPAFTPFRADGGGHHTHSMQEAGDHGHDYQTATSGNALFNNPGSYSNLGMSNAHNTWYQGGLQRIGYSNLFWASGNHTHTINHAVNHTHRILGGDTETKPNSVSLNFYIKINH